ncbi:CDP-glucose 4,6-dehydratase [Nocardioides salarius]|uniref:CDP-glucose 4,6-dehydratase n=1 Tax=Nocardioides salarius TaxID=374513 RepID=A0ABS2ME65_9ACTN|nr:CDP-glucose 4,6-dehydratase [Nocardioides salarius]MBM7509445.1 CDP-glucose 4,6-dehydratase [Nocardioides salarius]
MDPAHWRDRDVLVTGHTGFKGAWLSRLLHRMGARVHGYALATPEHFLHTRARCADDLVDDRVGDIRDRDRLTAAVEASGADTVLHLAAQSVVRESYRDPRETFSSNVDGTLAVLEAVLAVPRVRSCVVVTTDKVYRNNEWHWGYRESEPLGGDDPYSASKACAELLTHSMVASFPREGLGVATARAGNVVGGGDATPDALLPELVARFAAGEPARLRRPDAVRPWQHVLEPLSGYLTVAEHLPGRAHDRGWNFGPSSADTLSVADVAGLMARQWGEGARWEATGDPGPHEAGLLALDSTLARTELGWHPVLSAPEAVRITVDWEKSVRAGEPPREAVDRQVECYLERHAETRRS